MTDPQQFDKEIDKAIARNAGHRSVSEKEDLRQEAYMAILESGEVTEKALAYTIVETRIRSVLKKQWKHEDISSLAEEPLAPEQDIMFSLDVDIVIAALETLPHTEQVVIRSLFGIRTEPETIRSLAAKYQKTPNWVMKKKQVALTKLRALLMEIRER